MARALFGEQLEQAIETLNHQFHIVAVYVHTDRIYRAGNDTALRAKIDSTISSGLPSPEQNEMDQTIAAQVKRIEDICLPVLRLEGPRSGHG